MPLLGQALGAPFPENDVEMVARRFDGGHRILRDNATIVFDLDLQVVVRQHPLAQLEDFGEPIRSQAMIAVQTDVGLEQNRFVFSQHPAAIDKILHHVSHFSDVGMGRDGIAIRQNEARQSVRMLMQDRTKMIEFHA